MKLLITGASGFVGAAVAGLAAEQQHHVVATGARPAPSRLAALEGRIAYRQLDLANGSAVAEMLREEQPEAVIHCAWAGVARQARFSQVQLANVEMTCRLVEEAARAGVAKFVGIGSQAEYGRLDRRIGEDDPTQPETLYGAAKLAACHLARQLAAQSGMDYAWLRLFSSYGPGDNDAWLIPSIIAELSAGRRPRVSLGSQKWDYLHVDDAARGILAACVTPAATDLFNLASGRPVAIREVVERLRDLLAPGMDLVFGEIPFGKDQIMHLEGDNGRLRELTGWRPEISLEAGIAGMLRAENVR
jgi:nucleoside-diphosphate-sugar epimerase